MRYIKNTLDFMLPKRSIITLGKFDGLHRGHKKLVNRVKELKKPGFETVIFTFDVSPVMRLSDPSFKMILTGEERFHLAKGMDVDCLVECPFVPEIMHMDAKDFVREILVRQMKAAHLVVGPDFHFGHKRGGTTALLKEMGKQYGYQVDVLEKVTDGGAAVSSTRIRREIMEGNTRFAPLLDEMGGLNLDDYRKKLAAVLVRRAAEQCMEENKG